MDEIVNYWYDLKSNVNTKDPIFKWSVFSDEPTTRRYIEKIGEILGGYQFHSNNPFGWNANNHEIRKAFSCLFLVRCALIARLNLPDWDLSISDAFLTGIGQHYFDRNDDWRACITNAERELKRSSLMPLDFGGKARHYCARVLVEGGLPLYSLNPDTRVVKGLTNIWNLRKNTKSESAYERSVREFLDGGALEDPDGRASWLPGGAAGCRKFFGMGLELLENVISESKHSKRTYAQILSDNYGFYHPQDAIATIFGDTDAAKLSHSISGINIKRILHWEGDDDDLETQIWVWYEPKKTASCQKIILRNCKEQIASWSYDAGNHTINENPEPNCYYSNVESAAFIEVITSADSKKIEILQGMDFSAPIFFKCTEGNNFEETSSISEKSFPLCAIITDELVQDQNLDLRAVDARKFTINDKSTTYTVYKFPCIASFNRTGLSLTRVELVLERPSQMLSAVVKKNGHTYHNVLISTAVPQPPLRCWNSEVIYRESKDDEWNGIEDLSGSSWFYGFFKLDTSEANYSGKRIVVLPNHFQYHFEMQNGMITGVSFGDNQRIHMNPSAIYIDKAPVTSPNTWQNLNCNSLIQCEFAKPDGSKLVLTIPSPIPGISWFYLNKNVSISAFNYKSVVKLHCVQNIEGNAKYSYKIRLIDGDTELLNFDQPAVDRYGVNDLEMRLDLPAYLNRLFSATNSLNAKIEVVATASFGNQIISTEPLIITRFDESSYEGDYFCFGLMSLKVLSVNTDPSEDEKRIDKWIKVPARQSINEDWVWSGSNRIRPLGNDIEDISALSPFQLMLIGNDYEQVQRKLHNYFTGCNYQIDQDALKIISDYFAFCKKYNVPVCNLWLLQMVLQDDRILVQIPNIYEYRTLLDEKTFLCSFDWMLIRPDAIDKVADEKVRHLLKMHVESVFENVDENNFHDNLADFESLHLPNLTSTSEDISSYDDEIIKKELRDEIHDVAPTNWKCALYFITTRVVFGTDEDYQRWHSWALCTLKLMKCIDDHQVRSYLRKYRSTLKQIFDKNRFHDGVNEVVWNEWKMGEINSTFEEKPDIEDYFLYGKEHAYSRFYFRYALDAAKKIFGKNFYVTQYGIPWDIIQKSYPFESLEQIDERISELKKLYQVYKSNFEMESKFAGLDNLPKDICIRPNIFTLGKYSEDQISNIAKVNSKNVMLWQKIWPLAVDSFSLPSNCTKLIDNLKKLVPLKIVSEVLLDENQILELSHQITRRLTTIFNSATEFYVSASSLRSLGSKLFSNKKYELAKDVFNISYNTFGEYQSAYDLYESTYKINPRDDSLGNLLQQSKLYLDSRFFIKEGSQIYKQLDHDLLMGKKLNHQDLKFIEDQYELAASLGNKSGYVNSAKLAYYGLNQYYECLIQKYDERKFQHHDDFFAPIFFIDGIQKYTEKCLKSIKTMTHHYRCAARLNCKAAFYDYYRWLTQGIKKFKEIRKRYAACNKSKTEPVALASIERSFALIQNKIDLDNSWVYLRKAKKLYGESNGGVTLDWNDIKDSYCAKIQDPRDGQIYNIVNIDGKWWLAENLRFKTEGVLETNCGCLYTFDSLQNVMIEGWRCPTKAEYESLDQYCSLRSVAHNPAGVSLKSESWKDHGEIRDVLAGTDDFGFNAIPNGLFNSENKSIVRTNEAFFWTASKRDEQTAFGANLSSADNALDISTFAKKDALALRLVCERPDFLE